MQNHTAYSCENKRVIGHMLYVYGTHFPNPSNAAHSTFSPASTQFCFLFVCTAANGLIELNAHYVNCSIVAIAWEGPWLLLARSSSLDHPSCWLLSFLLGARFLFR